MTRHLALPAVAALLCVLTACGAASDAATTPSSAGSAATTTTTTTTTATDPGVRRTASSRRGTAQVLACLRERGFAGDAAPAAQVALRECIARTVRDGRTTSGTD